MNPNDMGAVLLALGGLLGMLAGALSVFVTRYEHADVLRRIARLEEDSHAARKVVA